jgi:hypothetical protein
MPRSGWGKPDVAVVDAQPCRQGAKGRAKTLPFVFGWLAGAPATVYFDGTQVSAR